MKVEKAYKNIEDIITYGFLYRGICYRDSVIILKTISDKEYKLIPFYIPDSNDNLPLYRLAFSTFMINGYNFLIDRNNNISKLIDFYNNISITSVQRLMANVNEVYKEYIDSLDFLEGFCYSDKSRVLWSIYKGSNNSSLCGIEGIDNIGLNSTQESWIVINRQLDEEEEYNKDFRLSLMVASSMNGKGCQKIENQYDFHKKELEEVREGIVKYGYDKRRILKSKEENKGWATPLKTREDTVRELNRQMSGDKDKHDIFIDDWIKKQKEKVEDTKRLSEEKQKVFRDKIKKDIDFTKLEDSRMATPEEVERMMKSKTIRGVESPSDPLEKKHNTEDVLRKISGTVIKNDR
jgi:hypothetical protein